MESATIITHQELVQLALSSLLALLAPTTTVVHGTTTNKCASPLVQPALLYFVPVRNILNVLIALEMPAHFV